MTKSSIHALVIQAREDKNPYIFEFAKMMLALINERDGYTVKKAIR